MILHVNKDRCKGNNPAKSQLGQAGLGVGPLTPKLPHGALLSSTAPPAEPHPTHSVEKAPAGPGGLHTCFPPGGVWTPCGCSTKGKPAGLSGEAHRPPSAACTGAPGLARALAALLRGALYNQLQKGCVRPRASPPPLGALPIAGDPPCSTRPPGASTHGAPPWREWEAGRDRLAPSSSQFLEIPA